MKTTIDIINLAVPDLPKEVSPVVKVTEKFKRFDSDNLFPHALALLNRPTIPHRPILTNKTIYTVGKGSVVDEKTEKLMKYIKK